MEALVSREFLGSKSWDGGEAIRVCLGHIRRLFGLTCDELCGGASCSRFRLSLWASPVKGSRRIYLEHGENSSCWWWGAEGGIHGLLNIYTAWFLVGALVHHKPGETKRYYLKLDLL